MRFERRNPVSAERVWEGKAADAADVAHALAVARAAFPDWADAPQASRVAIVQRFGELLAFEATRLADLIGLETGKPRWEAASEVQSMIAKVGISIRAQAERAGERSEEAAGMRSVLRHRPHGVLAVFGPFNFPGHLPNGHIVPALLAGNTVLFKPSELAPATAEACLRLWRQAGLPAGVLDVLQGGAETGALLAEADLDGLLFTGSARTGARLAQRFAQTPQRILALEMGGNNPLMVWEPEDVEVAAALVLQSAFLSAGQRCTCARRLILPVGGEGDDLLDALLALCERLRVDAWDAEPIPFMGSVITPAAAETLLSVQAQRVAAGGRVLRAMRILREGTGLLGPGLLDASDIALPDEEVFGPLLQVQRAQDFEHALQLAGATRFGLAAGLISREPARYEQFRRRLRVGVLNWNRPLTGASSGLPFGGVGASGNHRPSAWYAADYCAFPVASLESPRLQIPEIPGLAAAAPAS
ncbi:succinylglutamate-semialdehyde dehydrogenase [Niveibacterium sp. SC-1]|uniref:succinylglutamate-semialdehyde dehydrogenase n=1 Tax=Niveibacterium sp. SC-1 TaxID=3135646 RepID=UPI00311F1461